MAQKGTKADRMTRMGPKGKRTSTQTDGGAIKGAQNPSRRDSGTRKQRTSRYA